MTQFEEFENEPMICAVCEAMCPEAVDGTLSAAEQKAFEKHVAGCVHCAQELEEAQRGAAWMTMLKNHTPEPPAALLQRILAETTGAQAAFAPPPMHQEAVHEWATPSVVPPISAWSAQWATFRSRLGEAFSMESVRFMLQPRLAMTAAMAFFSIALTMNMVGIRVSDVRAGILRPSTLQRTVANASATAARNFQNLSVVYKVESRVSEMRSNGMNFGDERGIFGGSQKESAPRKNEPVAPKQDEQAAPEKTTPPQGKSALEFPGMPGTVVRKGA